MVKGASDRSKVVFDDERVVVNAGVMLAVTLGQRLGLEQLVDQTVRLGDRAGGSGDAWAHLNRAWGRRKTAMERRVSYLMINC